jgi:hypothetical protein
MATADEYAAWIVKNADKKGTPDFDVVAKAYQSARAGSESASPAEPAKPFGQQLNESISDIPRQIGLTARYGLKAAGTTAGLVTDPIGATINSLTGSNLKTAGSLADMTSDAIGLPKPRNATERIIGDASELAASGLGMASGAAKASNYLAGGAKKVANFFAANPLQQTISAGAAGGAGGYTRETGGDSTSQLVSAVAAGVAAPMAANKLTQIGVGANKLFQRAIAPAIPPATQNAQIDITVNNAMQSSGMTMADFPSNIQTGIRNDVRSAMDTGGTLSPDAIRRLADYRLTGATPRAGNLTLDPATLTQEKNLAKLGINSKDLAAQQLGQTENANNRLLIGGLNDLGASSTDSAIDGGRKVMNALSARNDRAKVLIDGRYAAARATDGRSAALDPSYFSNSANDALDAALLSGKLPADVRNLLNRAASGQMPLTVDTAEQFKTRIGDLQRSSTEPSERLALGLVRKALDNTPLIDGQGQGAIDAFNRARKLNAAYMNIVEKTPALQAVRDGIEPDKFVQQFIVGNGGSANVADITALRQSIKSSPEAMQSVRSQIASHLKEKALNGAADEVGNLSQSALNKAINSIGDEKLSLFFSSDELRQMKAIGRVSSYEQVQPRGTAVNNSNTAGTAIANILDRVGSSPLLSKIPLGSVMSQPAQNISVGIRSANALNVPNALLLGQPRSTSGRNMLLSPAAFLGNREEKNK